MDFAPETKSEVDLCICIFNSTKFIQNTVKTFKQSVLDLPLILRYVSNTIFTGKRKCCESLHRQRIPLIWCGATAPLTVHLWFSLNVWSLPMMSNGNPKPTKFRVKQTSVGPTWDILGMKTRLDQRTSAIRNILTYPPTWSTQVFTERYRWRWKVAFSSSSGWSSQDWGHGYFTYYYSPHCFSSLLLYRTHLRYWWRLSSKSTSCFSFIFCLVY